MNDDFYSAIERRIEAFVVALGGIFALAAFAGWGPRAAAAAAMGTTLCWVNFRWLRQGARAVMKVGFAQAGAETVRVPRSAQLKFLGRIGLLLAAAYVILVWLRLPAIPFLCGAAAVVPAVILELLYEAARGRHRWKAL